MDPSAEGFTPTKPLDAGMDTNSVASPPASATEGRPPKLKPKPEPPKNLSAMNLKMTEKDEEVAASVHTVLSETAAKEDKHTAASKVGHAIKEGAWLAVASCRAVTVMLALLMTQVQPYCHSTQYPISATGSPDDALQI
jgi:hypothetical protein